MTDLLPCPFCGGNELILKSKEFQKENLFVGCISCFDCHAMGSRWISSDLHFLNDDAAKAWNKRSKPKEK